MFFRLILPAFLFAAAYSDVANSASLSRRNRVELAPRGSAIVARRRAQLAARFHDSPEGSSPFLVLGTLPRYIETCQATFQAGPDVSIALQAVFVLHSRADDISNQIGDYEANENVSDQDLAEFKTQISNVFVELQALFVTGQDVYQDSWKARFRPLFTKFDVLVQTIATVCVNLQIDFDGQLSALHLDLNVFASAGLNLRRLGRGYRAN